MAFSGVTTVIRTGPKPIACRVAGCTVRAWEGAHPYHILAIGHAESQTSFIPTNVRYWNFMRRLDLAAGRPAIDDLYLPGVIRAKLWPADDCVLTIVFTAEDLSTQTFQLNQLNLSLHALLKASILSCNHKLFWRGRRNSTLIAHSSYAPHLRFRFTVERRRLSTNAAGSSQSPDHPATFWGTSRFIPDTRKSARRPSSDYYGIQTLTRDTLISLPGLLLATGRQREAGRILYWLARSFNQGLLPNHFPLTGSPVGANEYTNVDTTLWYFYALDAYVRTTHDYKLLNELYPRLAASIDWYIDGTENGISCDHNDGLLQANAPGKALTWMNATVPERKGQPGQPVTPRSGKPVEVNALWYCALSLMHEWSQSQYRNAHSDHAPAYYEERRKTLPSELPTEILARRSPDNRGYLYDVVDGPHGNDAALRPNQLLALSLRYPVLETQYRQPVFRASNTASLDSLWLAHTCPRRP